MIETYNTFDPIFYVYLNPELSNLDTVEDAHHHYRLFGKDDDLVHDRSIFTDVNFNDKVYFLLYSNQILYSDNSSNYLTQSIIDEINIDYEGEKRLSYIHYLRYYHINNSNLLSEEHELCRCCHSNEKIQVSIPDDFNEYLYRIFHKVTRNHMTREDIYIDYLKQTSDIKIGSLEDIEFHVMSNLLIDDQT